MLQWRFSPRASRERRASEVIETIGLCAPVFARHRDAGRMDDVGLNIARPQPAREPEPVAASLKADDDTLDVAPSPAGFAAPTARASAAFPLGIELLKRLAFDAGNERGNQPPRRRLCYLAPEK
jgi:hypothetical protein